MYKKAVLELVRAWIRMDLTCGNISHDNGALNVDLIPFESPAEGITLVIKSQTVSCAEFCSTIESLSDVLRQSGHNIVDIEFISATRFNASKGVIVTIEVSE